MTGMSGIGFDSMDGEGARIGRPADHSSPRCASPAAALVGA